jgi:hypothetical protein
MLPIPMMLMVGGLFTAPIEARPELLLPVRLERLPGESEVAYFKRELARIDALMQRCKADVARMGRENALALQRWEVLMKESLERELEKRKAQALGLAAVAGGIADHPALTFTAPAPTVDDLLEAEKRAAEQRIQAAHPNLQAELAAIHARSQRIAEEAERIARERRERAERKKK